MNAKEPTWFVRIQGQTLGPLSSQELEASMRVGEINLTDKVHRSGENLWQMVGENQALAAYWQKHRAKGPSFETPAATVLWKKPALPVLTKTKQVDAVPFPTAAAVAAPAHAPAPLSTVEIAPTPATENSEKPAANSSTLEVRAEKAPEITAVMIPAQKQKVTKTKTAKKKPAPVKKAKVAKPRIVAPAVSSSESPAPASSSDSEISPSTAPAESLPAPAPAETLPVVHPRKPRAPSVEFAPAPLPSNVELELVQLLEAKKLESERKARAALEAFPLLPEIPEVSQDFIEPAFGPKKKKSISSARALGWRKLLRHPALLSATVVVAFLLVGGAAYWAGQKTRDLKELPLPDPSSPTTQLPAASDPIQPLKAPTRPQRD